MNTLRVIAQGDGVVPFRDELGRWHQGRAFGRDADGTPRAELVPDTTFVRRAIARGDLVVAAEEPAPPADEAPPPDRSVTPEET